MAAKSSNRPAEPPPRFKVGDRVRFLWGFDPVEAVIVEDRGCIGHQGRRLYGITMHNPPAEARTFEMPEADLEPASNTNGSHPAPRLSESSARYFRVGDRVKLLFGKGQVEGVIVSDRGLIGVGGEQMYRLVLNLPHAEPLTVDMPISDLESAG
jgi:hypothetical protein